jgi:hypothetical protein
VDAICALREWLQDDHAVRQFGRLRWADAAGSGAAGVGLDALQLVVGNGLSVLELAVAIGQWRESRPSAPKVLISQSPMDGPVVSIESADPRILDGAIRALDDGAWR